MGMKLDIAIVNPDRRQVTPTEAQSMASSQHMIDCIETSAKQDMNIVMTFTSLARVLRKKHDGLLSMAVTDCDRSVSLSQRNGGIDAKENTECWFSC